MNDSAAIEFRSVSKKYGDRVVLDRLNLAIPQGKITVFVGPSGGGKTTSLRMINRMVEPSSGQILVRGQDNRSLPVHLLRRSMGYVLQEAGLMPHQTVLDNIATLPRLKGVKKQEAREQARELLGLVGLEASLADRYPAQLSGGQAQRVGVARALAAESDILLMDEPFSAVDPLVRADLQDNLLELQKKLQLTVVMVTHDMEEALFLGDQLAVFSSGGSLAQVASPQQVLENPATDFVAKFLGRDRRLGRLLADGRGQQA